MKDNRIAIKSLLLNSFKLNQDLVLNFPKPRRSIVLLTVSIRSRLEKISGIIIDPAFLIRVYNLSLRDMSTPRACFEREIVLKSLCISGI